MRQANKRIPESAEKTVRYIRRATRRSWPLFAIVVATLCASSAPPPLKSNLLASC
jgi:uncharacterized membrane protein